MAEVRMSRAHLRTGRARCGHADEDYAGPRRVAAFRSFVVLVPDGCRVRGGASAWAESCRAGRGELPGGSRRIAGCRAESFLVTDAFPCYHADNSPCCGNSPPGRREVSS